MYYHHLRACRHSPNLWALSLSFSWEFSFPPIISMTTRELTLTHRHRTLAKASFLNPWPLCTEAPNGIAFWAFPMDTITVGLHCPVGSCSCISSFIFFSPSPCDYGIDIYCLNGRLSYSMYLIHIFKVLTLKRTHYFSCEVCIIFWAPYDSWWHNHLSIHSKQESF